MLSFALVSAKGPFAAFNRTQLYYTIIIILKGSKQRRRAIGLAGGLVIIIDCGAASSLSPSGWPLLPSRCPLLFSPSSEIIIYFVFGGVLEMSGVRCCLAWHSLATRHQVSNNAPRLQYFNISNLYAHPYVLGSRLSWWWSW